VLSALVLALVTLLPGPDGVGEEPSAPLPGEQVTVVLPAGGPASASGRIVASDRIGSRWRAPVDGPVIVVRPFAPPPITWLPGHRGVDLAAARGDLVRAAGAGTVSFAGDLAGRGVVVVTHDRGVRTTYEPVSALVGVGDVVAVGEVIGSLAEGAAHCGGTSPCLHWGLRRGRDYLDPMLLLDPGRPVLLPP
jgi:murein DD-endopeptidase MepM/ murein hydrolase activator NlpD